MWDGKFCPDELKIYPTQLLEESPLFDVWKQGKFKPYTTEELINLIADIKPSIPIYSRVNRIVRDIPANYIKAGSRRSSLRQDVHIELKKRGQRCRCIRCRSHHVRRSTAGHDQSPHPKIQTMAPRYSLADPQEDQPRGRFWRQ